MSVSKLGKSPSPSAILIFYQNVDNVKKRWELRENMGDYGIPADFYYYRYHKLFYWDAGILTSARPTVLAGRVHPTRNPEVNCQLFLRVPLIASANLWPMPFQAHHLHDLITGGLCHISPSLSRNFRPIAFHTSSSHCFSLEDTVILGEKAESSKEV